jgi:hypothetical protein
VGYFIYAKVDIFRKCFEVCAMDMQQGHTAWPFAPWACSLDMQKGHSAWKNSMVK